MFANTVSIGLTFHIFTVFPEAQVFNFDAVQLICVFLCVCVCVCVFWVSYLRNHYLIQGHKDLHLSFTLKTFIVFSLTFRSISN